MDRALMIGFELWWANVMNEKSPIKRTKEDIIGEACDRWEFERSTAYEYLNRVNSLLSPELKVCKGDHFALIGRILSRIEIAEESGPTVVEIDQESGEVTYLEGWHDALEASLKKCGLSEHPARYLQAIIDAMKSERGRLEAERQALISRIHQLDTELNKFRGRGRPLKNTGHPRPS